jgi:hypothetical protein
VVRLASPGVSPQNALGKEMTDKDAVPGDIGITAASMVRIYGDAAVSRCEAMIKKHTQRPDRDAGIWPDVLVAVRALLGPSPPEEEKHAL